MKRVIVVTLAGAALSAFLVNPAWSCERCGVPDRETQTFRKVVRVLHTILNEPCGRPQKVVITSPARPRVKKVCSWKGCRTVWIGPQRPHGWQYAGRHHNYRR